MTHNIEHLKGLDLIVEERLRQVDKLGYTVEHDAEEHSVEELMRIGACYVDWAACDLEGVSMDSPHPFWPTDSTIPWIPEFSAMENAAKGAAFVAAALDLLHAKMMGEV